MKQLLLTVCAWSWLLVGRAWAGPLPSGPAQATLEFIENKGQWNAHARYAAPLPGGRLFAEADGLTLALLADGGPARPGHGAPPAGSDAAGATTTVRGHALTLRFVGAAPTTRLLPAGVTAEHRNYFLGADPHRWATEVRSFRTLRYAGLWPGVDAVLHESADQRLEYDFELAAGASAAAIVLRHEGAQDLTLDAAGNLRVSTSVGTFIERAPQAWQADAAGRHRAVGCRYRLAPEGTLSFVLSPYDHDRPLTIDPVVVFSTYSGSTADNWGFTATYDPQGNLYSGGIAFETGYPTTPGAFQTQFADLIDIALIKYNTGVSGPPARVWATYLGGAGAEFPHSLVVNNQGELLMLGSSGSADFPTTAGAVQPVFGGGTQTNPLGYGAPYNAPDGSDLVVARLAANGASLLGATFLGGSGNDGLLPLIPQLSPNEPSVQLAHNYGDPFRGDIVVDAADNVYIASHTASPDFPVANGLSEGYHGGTSDAVVCKLTPGLTALTWSSFVGGSGPDAAYSIQLEPGSGDVYVAGGTASANFPTTAGAYLPARPGRVDGFAARLSANGKVLLRATYVGTAAYDQAYFLQLGTDGGVYLLGQTTGPFPLTAGKYRTVGGTQFIQKLDANLTQSLFSTVFGSPPAAATPQLNISPTAFLVDRCDRIFVCGWGGQVNQNFFASQEYLNDNGTTSGLPVTPDGVQRTTDGSDFYLAQFSAGLMALAYGTYYGSTNAEGEHVDGGTSRFDPRGIVYQAVCSCFSSVGFPIPPGANTYSTTNNSSNCNNAAFVFNFQPGIANAGSDQTVCAAAGPQPLVGTPGGGFWTGPGVSGSAATGFVFTPSVALVGIQALVYTLPGTGLCTTTDTRLVTVFAPPTVTFTPLLQTTYCLIGSTVPPPVPLTATPAGGTFSGPGVSGSVATGFVFAPSLLPTGTVPLVYSLTTNGCVVQATQPVTVSRLGTVTAGTDSVLCAGSTRLVPLRGSPAGGTWTGPGVSGSAATGFVFTPALAPLGVQTLTYTVTGLGGCTTTGTRRLTLLAAPTVVFTPLPQATYCLIGSTVPPSVPLTATPAGGTFSGPGVSGSVATGFVFAPGAVPTGTVPIVYSLAANGCVVQASQTVTVTRLPVITAGTDTVLCAGSTQPVPLRGSPAGGTWAGPGVSGSAATGFVFTPPLGFVGSVSLTYTVVVNGCFGAATRQIAGAPAPTLVPAWVAVACAETRLAPLTLRFSVASSGGLTGLTWDFGDGTQATDLSPTHTYAAPGHYQPSVRARYNAGRCDIQALAPSVEAFERRVPNVITPNGDGLNETFRLGPDCSPHLQIFSRWGQRVYEAATYHDEWDAAGRPDGLYYYLLSYPDGHRVKGWVEVVR